MAFETYEESVEGGQPIELYAFGYQGGTFRYTSAKHDVVFESNTYAQTPGLSRSADTDTGEISKASLNITAPEDFAVARLFEVYPPSDVVDLTVTRVHKADLTDGKVLWLGRVINAEWSVGYSTLICESLFTRLRQPGLRRAYSRNCQHVLYGSDCQVSQIAFVVPLNVDALTGGGFYLVSSVAATYPANYFSGGKLAWESSPGVFERRGIKAHTGDTLTLTHPIPSLPLAATVQVSAGCDRTKATCVGRFANLVNYGGFPYVPEKNPFGTNTVY